jgi:hypothetical protein
LKEAATRHARAVATVFAPELDGAHAPTDRRAAITVATSWEAWDTLRRTQRCSVDTARRAVTALVAGVVARRH